MDFTTATEIARKWSKAFWIDGYSIVMNNNKPVWLIFGTGLTKIMLNGWILEQLREELWEINDEETKQIVEKSKLWDYSDSISLDDYVAKYGV
jgi:hypothetical protein